MLHAIIDNISVLFCGLVVQQTIGIPAGTNYAPLLAVCFFMLMSQTSVTGFSRIMTAN